MSNMLADLNAILKEDEVKSYAKNGFLHLKNVFSQQDVEELRAAVSHQINGLATTETGYDFESLAELVWSGADDIGDGHADRFDLELYKAMIDHDASARPIQEMPNDAADKKGQFFYDAAGWRKYEGIRRAALDSALPQLCAQLLSSEYLNFWEDTTFVKAPNTMQKNRLSPRLCLFPNSRKKMLYSVDTAR